MHLARPVATSVLTTSTGARTRGATARPGRIVYVLSRPIRGPLGGYARTNIHVCNLAYGYPETLAFGRDTSVRWSVIRGGVPLSLRLFSRAGGLYTPAFLRTLRSQRTTRRPIWRWRTTALQSATPPRERRMCAAFLRPRCRCPPIADVQPSLHRRSRALCGPAAVRVHRPLSPRRPHAFDARRLNGLSREAPCRAAALLPSMHIGDWPPRPVPRPRAPPALIPHAVGRRARNGMHRGALLHRRAAVIRLLPAARTIVAEPRSNLRGISLANEWLRIHLA
ncbi:hypothetical protein FB451DRAFT_1272612 [Mycena latifolia]|nr:hypothetical protein FB451DRAFT_1282503 [Mycena latifolia]KAJ7459375.1 hypothetical protein FB451DRAFT_1272612 [Mycena latifolia]